MLCVWLQSTRGFTWQSLFLSLAGPNLADNIMGKIKEAGFQVSLSKETHLTKEMAEQLYSQQKGKEFFNDLTNIMSR